MYYTSLATPLTTVVAVYGLLLQCTDVRYKKYSAPPGGQNQIGSGVNKVMQNKPGSHIKNAAKNPLKTKRYGIMFVLIIHPKETQILMTFHWPVITLTLRTDDTVIVN